MVIRRLMIAVGLAGSLAAADPVLSIANGTTTYQVGDAAIRLDTAASVSDSDNPASFDTGTILLTVLNVVDDGGVGLVPDASDALIVVPGDYVVGANTWRVALSGSLVQVGQVVSGNATLTTIASWSGGSGGTELRLQLNRESTIERSTAILRALGFRNQAGASAVIGTRTIGITFTDGTVGSNAAAAQTKVRVVGPPQSPTANAQSIGGLEDQPILGNLTGSDPDSTSLTYLLATNPAHGNVTITDAQTGAFTYTPAANYAGADNFTFKVSDGALESDAASVSVVVSAVNDPPSFVGGGTVTATSTGQSTQVAGYLGAISSGGGSDEAGQTVTFAVNTDHPEYFTVQPVIGTDGTLTFTAVSHVSGTAALTIIGQDSGGVANGGDDEADPVVGSIILSGATVPPVVLPVKIATQPGVRVTVTPTVTSAAGSVVFVMTSASSLGTASISSSTGAITFTPERAGTETLMAQASNTAGTTVFAVTITVTSLTDATRPKLITAPTDETVVAGSTWSYQAVVSSASVLPGTTLGAIVSGASGVTVTRTQGNLFTVTSPTSISESLLRLHLVVYDETTLKSDAQVLLVRVLPLGAGG